MAPIALYPDSLVAQILAAPTLPDQVAIADYWLQQNKSLAFYAGSLFPVGKHVEFNLYYEHENDTGKRPNRQNNYVGLCLYLFSP